MPETKSQPLTIQDLEAAAYLYLEAAAWTDLDQFPPGVGQLRNREHHARKKRFEQAQEKVQSGVSDLGQLGLTSEDCAWAASKSARAKDSEGWFSRFKQAKERLEQLELTLRDIRISLGEVHER